MLEVIEAAACLSCSASCIVAIWSGGDRPLSREAAGLHESATTMSGMST